MSPDTTDSDHNCVSDHLPPLRHEVLELLEPLLLTNLEMHDELIFAANYICRATVSIQIGFQTQLK